MEIVTLVVALPFLVFIAVVVARVETRLREGRRATAILHLRMQAVMTHLGVQDVAHPQVLDELMQGRKIHAIKAYMDATGTDLAEAKRAVDALA